MNVLDIILLILILAAAVSGFSKGFFIELASIASLILGIWAAIGFSDIVQQWLSHILSWSPSSLKLIAFILIFIIVVIIVHLIAKLFENAIQAIALGIFSRLAGAVLGALKGAFILSVLLLVVTKIESFTTTIIPEQTKKESKLYGPIDNFAPNILPFLKKYKETNPQGKGSGVLI
jgi:membrane protein required for colicin V production